MAAHAGREGQGDTTEQIVELGTTLLKDFIYERIRRYADHTTEVTRAQLGGTEICNPTEKKLAACLQEIGDVLDGNMELQSMINCSTLSPTKEVFVKVAIEIFADGKFNWGRVVTLFYFACRLIIKALMSSLPDIIQTIIDWTIGYIREHLLHWIREQGGWEGMRSFFGTPGWQVAGVVLAGVITFAFVVRKI
ncbi:apoptosis regulator BAX-like [Stigmatopora nigra]